MSELESLTSRAADLTSKVDFWNNAVLVALFVTALAAAAIVAAQRKAFVRAKDLSDVQDQIAVVKGKEADARIAEAQRASAEATASATKAQESLALAELHSAEANAKAEGFRLDIAKANETAERERLARLQLEARLADRVLTPAQQASIASRLRVFGQRRIDVIAFGNTPEISRITNAILGAVQDAGWTVGNAGSAMGGSAAGVLIGTHLGASADDNAAADSMIAALRAAGIISDRLGQYDDELPVAMTGNWNNKAAPIRMIVGAKP